MIDTSKTNAKIGTIVTKDKSADSVILEYINLGDKESRKWYHESKDLLKEAVDSGKLTRVIKLLDDDSNQYTRAGNIMHDFITWEDSIKALDEIEKIFRSHYAWEDLSEEGIIDYAKKDLGLNHKNNKKYLKEIKEEANNSKIKGTPTILLNEEETKQDVAISKLKNMVLKSNPTN